MQNCLKECNTFLTGSLLQYWNQILDFIKPFIFCALFLEGSCQNDLVWFSLTMVGWLDSIWQNNSVKYTIPGKENLNWLLDEIMQNGAWNYNRISFAGECFKNIIIFRLSIINFILTKCYDVIFAVIWPLSK